MKNILVLLCLGLFVASCHKESDVLEGNYTLPASMTVDKVRMYTSNGEVTNEVEIKNFLKNIQNPFSEEVEDYSDKFYFDQSKVSLNDADPHECSVKINGETAFIKTKMFRMRGADNGLNTDIVRNGNLLILTGSAGTISAEKLNSIEEYYNEYYNDNFSFINSYPFERFVSKICLQIGSSVPLDPKKGFESGYKLRTNFPLVVEHNQLFIPVLILLDYYSGENNISCNWEMQWNIPNENSLKSVAPNRTIVVQEGRIILQKQ